MSFEICDGDRCYLVTTEVGDGLTRVVVKELNPPAQPALEPSEDA